MTIVWLLEIDSRDVDDRTPEKVGVFASLDGAKFAAQEVLERRDVEWRQQVRIMAARDLSRAKHGEGSRTPQVVEASLAEAMAMNYRYEWENHELYTSGSSGLLDVTITQWSVEE